MSGLSEEDKRRIREEEIARFSAKKQEEEQYREQVRKELETQERTGAEESYREQIRQELEASKPVIEPPTTIEPKVHERKNIGPGIAPPKENSPSAIDIKTRSAPRNVVIPESKSIKWGAVVAGLLFCGGIGLGVMGFLEFRKNSPIDDGPGQSLGNLVASDSELDIESLSEPEPDPPVVVSDPGPVPVPTDGAPMDWDLPDEKGTKVIREPDGTIKVVPITPGGD